MRGREGIIGGWAGRGM